MNHRVDRIDSHEPTEHPAGPPDYSEKHKTPPKKIVVHGWYTISSAASNGKSRLKMANSVLLVP